ncbi:MAG: toxin-activating lysine-acyltransferase [Pseudomonadota bacterium]
MTMLADSQVYTQIGEALSLMGQVPLYANRTLSQLGDLLLPALAQGQIRVWKRAAQPVAMATWAWLDAKTEALVLECDHVLAPNEWCCGDRPVVIDMVAPFQDGFAVARDLSRNVFAGHTVRAVRRDACGRARRQSRFHCATRTTR